ncbi:MAG: rRNA maturation RNase YbeY [Clostridia bacterium]
MKLNTFNIGKEDKLLILQVYECAMKYLKQTAPMEVELSFIGKDTIKDINMQERGKDCVTDVLSFPYLSGIKGRILEVAQQEEDVNFDTGNIMLGEILICKLKAKMQADEYGHSYKREVAFLALHGLLHLLGYDHITDEDRIEMDGIANAVLEELEITR